MAISFGAWYWTGYAGPDGAGGTWAFIGLYCAYVFFSIMGVLQFVSAKWDFKGISFFRSKKWSYAFSALALIGPAAWFFTAYDCTKLTFDAPVQIFYIAVCTIFAFLCTFFIAHLIHGDMRRIKAKDDVPEGIEILKETTYWGALSQLLKRKRQ